MTLAIAHRGPDGDGFYLNGSLGLGHRRLAILDLSDSGKQPMSYANERYWITYNGEVYNFIELRHELETKGYSFISQSDTEVILAAYDCWGTECLKRFNGMWAFAIWDCHRKELFLSRDRFGVKPLFFFASKKRFAFASEIKALLKVYALDIRPNVAVVREYLSWSGEQNHCQTIYEKIYRLSAGTWMKVTPEGIQSEVAWWGTWENRPQVPKHSRSQVEQFLDLLKDAIRIRLRSDVPVGTLLSGGMDSSSIVSLIASLRSDPEWLATAQRVAPDWQRTFTAEYPGLSADEGDYARAVLDAGKIQGTLIQPTISDLPSFIEHIIDQQDTPVGQSLYAVHSVYQAVGQSGVKVTLDGQGADEMLSGYETLTAARYYLQHGRLNQMRKALETQLLLSGSKTPLNAYQRQVILSELGERYHVRSRLRKFFGIKHQEPQTSLCEPDWGAPSTDLLTMPDLVNDYSAPTNANLLDAALHRQLHDNLLPGILQRFDHAAMSYSVESRMPFMDWRLITYCLALPAEQKVNRGYTKWILRQAMQGIVPNKVLERRTKLGFPIPYEWLTEKRVQDWVRQIIYEPCFLKIKYWDGAKFQKWFEQKNKTGWQPYDHVVVFNVISTFLWYTRLFGQV